MLILRIYIGVVFFFKQKTAYEMRISDWSSDVCSSDLIDAQHAMDYRAWNFTQEDNFCRVDLDPRRHSLQVAAMNKKGEVIRKRNWRGEASGAPLVTELKLAPW